MEFPEESDSAFDNTFSDALSNSEIPDFVNDSDSNASNVDAVRSTSEVSDFWSNWQVPQATSLPRSTVAAGNVMFEESLQVTEICKISVPNGDTKVYGFAESGDDDAVCINEACCISIAEHRKKKSTELNHNQSVVTFNYQQDEDVEECLFQQTNLKTAPPVSIIAPSGACYVSNCSAPLLFPTSFHNCVSANLLRTHSDYFSFLGVDDAYSFYQMYEFSDESIESHSTPPVETSEQDDISSPVDDEGGDSDNE